MTVAIVLAAGDGTRLRPVTDTCPKPLVPLPGGSTPLGLVVSTLHALSIETVIVARKDERVQAEGCEMVDVRGGGNMVNTLMTAVPSIIPRIDDVLVCYSDLILERRLVEAMLQSPVSPTECTVAVDTEWEQYYRWRFNGTVGDAESLLIADECIVDIGHPLHGNDPLPQGQYIGLIRMSRQVLDVVCRIYQELANPNLYMTDVLRELPNRGIRLKPVRTAGGWLELDTVSDYEMAVSLLEGREHAPFFDPQGIS